MLSTTEEIGIGAAIERLAAMPAFLEAALASAPAAALAVRGSGGEFALVEHACHLRDLEREGYLVRVRRMLSEPLAALEPFHGDVVARERNYLAQDARRAAEDFAAARGELTAVLSATTAADLDRAATFAQRRITLRELVAMIEEHDGGHRAEIDRLLARVRAGAPT